MRTALLILVVQGGIGAFDTLWFHEWRGRLPTRAEARKELALHAARDFVYAVLFSTLAWCTWEGAWAAVLVALLTIEIAITLADFIVEDRTRLLAAGERVTHAIMGIVYGAFLAYCLPQIARWWQLPTGFGSVNYGWLSVVLTAMAMGVALAGIRDSLALLPKHR